MSDAPQPEPEPIRFYGTRWVDHSRGYAALRVGLGLGALLLAVGGALVLRLAYDGLAIAEVGAWANIAVIVMFAVCSSVGFSRTMKRFQRRPETAEERARDQQMRSITMIGFIGVLIAYALRTCVEAPGERLRREEYEAAVRRTDKRRGTRTGNPAKRRRRR